MMTIGGTQNNFDQLRENAKHFAKIDVKYPLRSCEKQQIKDQGLQSHVIYQLIYLHYRKVCMGVINPYPK